MLNSLRFLSTSFVELMVLSLAFAPSSHATQWVGNDNGEFQTDGYPSYVAVKEQINTGLSWSSSPRSNLTSLQYNPDLDYSRSHQTNGQWFQAGIISDSNGCITYTVQIYDIVSRDLLWVDFYPTVAPCKVVTDALDQYSFLYITEDVSSNFIQDVNFMLMSDVDSLGYISYPPQSNWYLWLRSNVCWCGVRLGTTTFTSGAGNNVIYSDKNMVQIPPPYDVATAENSNMQYGCWTLPSGPSVLVQTFGLSGRC